MKRTPFQPNPAYRGLKRSGFQPNLEAKGLSRGSGFKPRSTPLTAGKPLKQGGKLKSVSDALKAERKGYAVNAKRYVAAHPVCEHCLERWAAGEITEAEILPATDVHHTARKVGDLLHDVRFWMAVNRLCHDWIPVHSAESYVRGWLISQHLTLADKLGVLLAKRGRFAHVAQNSAKPP